MSEMDKLQRLAQEHHDMKKLVRAQAKKITKLEEQLAKIRNFVKAEGEWWL